MSRTLPLSFPLAPTSTSTAPANGRPGLIRRLFARMMAAQQRRAEREVARFLASSGLKFTDSTEREIERRFISSRPFDLN